MKFLDDIVDRALTLSWGAVSETDQSGQLHYYPWGKGKQGYVIPTAEKQQEIKTRLREGIRYSYLIGLCVMVGGLIFGPFLVYMVLNQVLDKESAPYWVLGYSALAPSFLIPILRAKRRAVEGLPKVPCPTHMSTSRAR